MAYYDGDLKAVLARFHGQPDTDTRKDILKKFSDNQLSRVVIQGVKCEFEREGLEQIALVVLSVISRDSRSKHARDLDEENGVAVKHEEADEECEVVIKMEELDDDDDDRFTMMRSKPDNSELAPTPGPSTIASVSTSPSPKLGREASRVPRTKHKAGRRVEAHYSKWKRDRDAAQARYTFPQRPRWRV